MVASMGPRVTTPVRIAERAGLHETSMAWGWQTFLLGFPSLGLLERGQAERAAPSDEDVTETR